MISYYILYYGGNCHAVSEWGAEPKKALQYLMLKIVHTGDIHLDSPFSGLDIRRAEIRKTELRGTFSSLMTYVRTEAVDMLLIAGDLFDRGFVTRETLAIIMREFSRVPDCRIIISPGNHDPYTPDSVYAKVKFPPNVHIFSEKAVGRFEFPEINCDVYGYAFTGETYAESPVFAPEENGRLRILCAHADLNAPASTYAPVTSSQIVAAGFDYAALGHVHNPPELTKSGNCIFGYCGCFEGRGFDEAGVKGAYCVEIGDDGKKAVRRISYARRHYESVSVSVAGSSSLLEIKERIRELIRERKFSDDTLLRVTLTGELPSTLVVSPAALADGVDEVFALEIRDATVPALNTDYLDSDPTVRGAFFRELKPKLADPDPTVRATALRALRYGLSAMSGETIAD